MMALKCHIQVQSYLITFSISWHFLTQAIQSLNEMIPHINRLMGREARTALQISVTFKSSLVCLFCVSAGYSLRITIMHSLSQNFNLWHRGWFSTFTKNSFSLGDSFCNGLEFFPLYNYASPHIYIWRNAGTLKTIFIYLLQINNGYWLWVPSCVWKII